MCYPIMCQQPYALETNQVDNTLLSGWGGGGGGGGGDFETDNMFLFDATRIEN